MYMSTQNGHSRLATFLVETESRNTLVNSKKKTWRWWQAIVLRPIPLPRALALPSPSHQDATTPSPCWAPHFMTQERLLFSNPNPSELRLRILPPRRWATTCCRFSLLPCPAPLSCSLQPLLKLSLLSLRPSLLQFVSIDSLLLSHENPSFEPMCVFHLFISCLCFLIAMNFSFKSLFAIWSLSLQRLHYYFYFRIVSWHYQKYWTILILVLCLLFVTPLVCSSYSSFAPSPPFFSSWWQRDCELFTHTLVLQGSPSTSSRQPQMTHVFADSRIGSLCHALRICFAHAPPETCHSFLLVHWAFRACYRNRLWLLHHAFLPQN